MPARPNTSESNRKKTPGKIVRRRDARRKAVQDGDPAGAIIADVQRLRAIRLKINGYTIRMIADDLHVSVATAFKYVNDGWGKLDDTTDETRKQLRATEEERLDAAVRVIMPALEQGVKFMALLGEDNVVLLEHPLMLQLKAIDRLVRIGQRRAKLRGLDQAPPAETLLKETDTQFTPLKELKRILEQANAATAKPSAS